MSEDEADIFGLELTRPFVSRSERLTSGAGYRASHLRRSKVPRLESELPIQVDGSIFTSIFPASLFTSRARVLFLVRSNPVVAARVA